jgi:hypothetical protein
MKCNRFISAWLCRRIAEPFPETPYAKRKHPRQKRQFRDANKTRFSEEIVPFRESRDASCAITRAPCAIERASRLARNQEYFVVIFQQCIRNESDVLDS